MKQSVFAGLMRRDLAEILGCEPDALPAVFLIERSPLPLKIGADLDVLIAV
jgi:hypothetical protein